MGFVERLERASAALGEGALGEGTPAGGELGEGPPDEGTPAGGTPADGTLAEGDSEVGDAAGVGARGRGRETLAAAWVGQMLAAELPELLAGIAHDRSSGAFARWGLSTVVDENLREPVIGRALFEFLHEYAGVAATWPIGNAGVLHVYGYLLSAVSTRYGLKRERWLGAELTTALGMPEGAFLDALTSAGSGAGAGAGSGTGAGAPAGGAADSGTVAGAGAGGAADSGTVAGGAADSDAGLGAGGSAGLAGCVADVVMSTLESAVVTVDEFAGEEREEVFRAAYLSATPAAGGASGSEAASGDVVAGGTVGNGAARGDAAGSGAVGGGAVAYVALLGDAHRLVTVFPVAASAEEWLAAFTAEPPRLRYNAAAHELAPRAPLASRRIERAGSLPPRSG
ncbi:hypothetical protein [Subtercola endophyticus]|uniref:hypothetical protein n=1 Tax=Subtercola endophyticus TaxID=2895559 RepID=UPI001E659F9D|nr:hypothetical protein [Subtercola endophyticus]UFS57426.1 hypothetical protein LQ955_10140 [Subtercola endophyticus]